MPDASSNDFEYHEELKTMGVPVLVLDHHILETEVSDNAIVINNQSSLNYHNKELTGAGVVWQFCRYVDSVTGHDYAMYFTDLAALGIIGDMGGLNEIEN
jgi:single-stranded-DNA-specific exonuclease